MRLEGGMPSRVRWNDRLSSFLGQSGRAHVVPPHLTMFRPDCQGAVAADKYGGGDEVEK